MTKIYQARCSQCDFVSAEFSSAQGALFVDGPAPVETSHGRPLGYGAAYLVKRSDPRLVELPLGRELEVMAEYGHNWDTVAKSGSFFRIRPVACEDCGTIFEASRLDYEAGPGCLVGALLGVPLGVGIGYWLDSIFMGFMIFAGLFLGCAAVIDGWCRYRTRARFRERAAQLDGPNRCPRCGSSEFIEARSRQEAPCPKCRKRTMRFHEVHDD